MSSNAESDIDIQLDKNSATAQLKDGKKILSLFDSGATRSIISETAIRNSMYLSSLTKSNATPVSTWQWQLY